MQFIQPPLRMAPVEILDLIQLLCKVHPIIYQVLQKKFQIPVT